MMGESDDDDVADISNVLLETTNDKEDPFLFDDAPKAKRKKSSFKQGDKSGPTSEFDFLSNEPVVKSKLNKSAFKNMGSTMLRVL